jgi:hypothetical protein
MPPDPINWATISPQGGQGDRHHRAAPTPLVMWKCPACASEQSGDLKYGCQACGSGRPGYKAEVKPPVHKDPSMTTGMDVVAYAFAAWAVDHAVDPVDRPLCWEAWKAGMQYAGQVLVRSHTDARPRQAEVHADSSMPLPGTPESRTLAAALTYFLDHVLSESPEECEDGTWITPEQAKALIQQLEGS